MTLSRLIGGFVLAHWRAYAASAWLLSVIALLGGCLPGQNGQRADGLVARRLTGAALGQEIGLRLPQGCDTPLGEGGARLSVGKTQLIAIARALAGGPRNLLLDEATAPIDSQPKGRVQQALTALHGRIAEPGTHSTLMALDGGRYLRLVKLQQLQQEGDDEAPGLGAGDV